MSMDIVIWAACSLSVPGDLPESESWKVSWIEIETPHGTDVQQRTAWEGYLTVRQVPPTTAATIEYNPLGLYITAINWTQISFAR